MKRLFLLLIALCAGLSAMAQEQELSWRDKIVHPKFDVRLSIGGPNGLYFYPNAEFGNSDWRDGYWKSSYKLADIYEPYYKIDSTPTFTAEFNWHPAKFLYVGADLSWNRAWGRRYDPVTDTKIGDKKISSAYLMGKAAFYWVQLPHFKFYSSLYAGAEIRQSKIDDDTSLGLKPAFDVNMTGVEWAGDVVFGFAEMLLGTRMNMIKLGVGLRF
ncbi:MAG: hypothetical protein J5632_01125 [Bacteroidales bacterium]|nr:hypothetical protein [Bacteroidales bacterium]